GRRPPTRPAPRGTPRASAAYKRTAARADRAPHLRRTAFPRPRATAPAPPGREPPPPGERPAAATGAVAGSPPPLRLRAAAASLAQSFQVALRDRGEALARERACLGMIDELFEGSGDEHASHGRILGRDACHLVQDRESSVDLVAGRPVVLDGAGEVLAETAV